MERMNITAIRTNGSPVTQQFDYDGSPHQAVFTCGRRAATGRLGLVIATLQDWDDDTTYGGIIRVFINVSDWTAEFGTVRHAVDYILSDGYFTQESPDAADPTPLHEWTSR